MNKITIGIIGAGDILGSHLAALKLHPQFKLVGICRRTEANLRKIAAELGVPGYTDYRTLLATKPDAVLVALPHGLHAAVTEEAFQAGCHVLVEKPMAVNAAECRRMLAAAARAGRHLIVTDSATFIPGALRTGEKFRSGDLGPFFTGSILNFRFYFHEGRPEWFLDPIQSGGGMFSNVGLHRLALARACLRGLDPIGVTAAVSRRPEWPVEACTSAMLRYRDGGAMLFEEVGYYPRPEWINAGHHFVFAEGIVAWTEQVWRLMTRQGKLVEEPLPPATGYAGVYANLLKAIRGEPYWPAAREYAADTAIAQAAYASAQAQKEIDLTGPDWAMP
jgi:predicted dehydrogenase